ncbi:phosphoadenylyl-sulfate reductase [Cellulomonas dongxiuzhuiae]|uniref:Adenosine 5'-phosphosulfate reductase n=1 Tax=Cellulomonas dongxiuzhuiae TaxID=2819979 RepID=A0ABX8GPI8_9CELL|nr:phosphoadenylyl-sulfate reductase [Cellulomonas dongxiuzhuiae]MBO3087307.1 phosphoadenylyl-sulfate reductase [Cellulomonas dongxiuzhuiae]MBO3093296.1 phosphoadenylyl-sulfate reductase [Cellulomonas dongxiuzhuiae]QWC17581.1 phosphoadenylyl-sulfate reductase [Cellulomonas dongxiuzhuiae]
MSAATRPATDLSPDELRALAELAGRDLEGAHPADVLRWARAVFGTDLVLASSMGDEVLVDIAAKAAPGIDVIFLDTGYHFAETIGTRDYYADFTDVSLRTVLPLRTVAEQDAEHGPRLHERDPNLCCALRKVEPLERGLAPYTAWVTGMRREDAPTRTDITVVGWDARRSKVKLNPLAAWTWDDVNAYVAEHHVVLNPLRELGYASIGCAPCTRAVAPGEDPRAGRWAGTNKTECGLHT